MKTKTWHVVILKTYVDDVAEYLATYSNRGQALAKLRGLMRRAKASEMRYAMRRG
ncbi:MAG: hypothetical protein ACREYE_04825 [Gammaproteobacteria bacterium]